MTKKTNNFNLKNNIGNLLQLQFSPGNDRYYVKLVGYVEGKSIIVTTPYDNELPIRVPEGQSFIVRLLSGKSAKVFTTSAIYITSYPFPHLHLSYPNMLESKNVRKAERIKCKIIVTVQNEEPDKTFEDSKSAVIPNISKAGAQLVSVEELGGVGDRIILSSKITVAELKEQYMRITAIIRRAIKNEKNTIRHEYGLEFTFDGENSSNMDKLLLYSFVYEKMLEGIH